MYRQSFGLVPAEVIANTVARTSKNYQMLYIIEDTVIASLTAPNLTNASSLAGKTLPAGMQLSTNITAITLTSGTCIAYNSDDSAI